MKKKVLALILALAIVFSAVGQLAVLADDAPAEISTQVSDISQIAKYGNVDVDLTIADFLAAGYQVGDLVNVTFLGQTLTLPVGDNYSNVDSGTAGVFVRSEDTSVKLAINMGNFAETYGIATKTVNADKTYFWTLNDGVTLPLEVKISMNEQGGYYEEYVMHSISYTDERSDYPDLTDAQFANFRNVSTTGMGTNKLYRSASPINPEHNRNTYADAAIQSAGVTVAMNLADDTATAQSYEGYGSSYYSTTEYIALNLGVDVTSADFKTGLADGLRFFAENPGTYLVHCTEGKDRAGFVCALLECLMGASADEVVSDYMTTYYNYYGITSSDSRYSTIASGNIIRSLQTVFGVSDIYTADLQACAEQYIREAGLSDAEIAALKTNLGDPVTPQNQNSDSDSTPGDSGSAPDSSTPDSSNSSDSTPSGNASSNISDATGGNNRMVCVMVLLMAAMAGASVCAVNAAGKKKDRQ